jgi:hypothetical protein
MKQKLRNWSKKWRNCWSISLKYTNKKEWLRWQRVRQTGGLSTESKRNQSSCSKAFILKDQRS